MTKKPGNKNPFERQIQDKLAFAFGAKVAKTIIDNHDCGQVASLTIDQLMRYGVPEKKAIKAHALLSLHRSVANAVAMRDGRLANAKAIAERYLPYFSTLRHEEFWLVCLDTNLRVMSDYMIGRGGLGSCNAAITTLMRHVLLQGSPRFFVMHNHPSGVALPSDDDNLTTRQIVEAARLFDIQCVDHVIFGHDTHYSYAEEGKMPVR